MKKFVSISILFCLIFQFMAFGDGNTNIFINPFDFDTNPNISSLNDRNANIGISDANKIIQNEIKANSESDNLKSEGNKKSNSKKNKTPSSNQSEIAISYIKKKIQESKEIGNELMAIYDNPGIIKFGGSLQAGVAIPQISGAWVSTYEQTALSSSLDLAGSGYLPFFGWSLGVRVGGVTPKRFYAFAEANVLWIENYPTSSSSYISTDQSSFPKSSLEYDNNMLNGFMTSVVGGIRTNILGNHLDSNYWGSFEFGGGIAFYWANGVSLYNASIMPTVFGGASLNRKITKNIYVSLDAKIYFMIVGRRGLDSVTNDKSDLLDDNRTLVNNYAEFKPMIISSIGISVHFKQ